MTPSRARFTLLRFAFALSVVTYLDRVCIATAATAIREDLHLTAVQMGWVFSAFTIAYAIFEIPSGRLGDTMGPRKVLTRIVLWWSAVFWAVLWWRWFRDDPAKHPAVNADELRTIREDRSANEEYRKIPWRSLLSRNLLFICVTYFAFGYGLYFYLTWLQTYLREARGFSANQASLLASLVLLSGAGASIVGGFWTDHWVKRYGLRVGRSGVAAISLVGSGLILGIAAVTDNSVAAAM